MFKVVANLFGYLLTLPVSKDASAQGDTFRFYEGVKTSQMLMKCYMMLFQYKMLLYLSKSLKIKPQGEHPIFSK